MTHKTTEFSLSLDGVEIHGTLYLPHSEKPVPALLMAHGFASCRKEAGDFPACVASLGYAVATFDFRGHGRSTGVRGLFTSESHLADITAVYRFLRDQPGVDPERMAVFGHSLGSAAALRLLAAEEGVKCGILGAPISWIRFNIPDPDYVIYATAYYLTRRLTKLTGLYFPIPNKTPYRQLFASKDAVARAKAHPFLLRLIPAMDFEYLIHQCDNRENAAKVRKPVLVIAGAKDELVHPKHCEDVYRALAGEKQYVSLENSGHSFMMDQEQGEAVELVGEWLEKYFGEGH